MDTITLKYDGTTIDTISNNEVSLGVDENGIPTYNDGTATHYVDQVIAELDSVNMTIHALGSDITINNIRATASADNVTSLIRWQDNPTTPGVDITFTTPDVSGDYMRWVIGEEIPPIRLNVKIVRR